MSPTRRPLHALLLALPCLAACQADKRLWIESEPSGATVVFDHQVIGTTPFEMEFIHYGTHRLGLELDGYLPYERDLLVPAPWYARFPLDIFSEVLFPIGWEDHKVAHVALEPIEDRLDEEQLEHVRARAESFRHATAEGPQNLPPRNDQVVTPLVAVPR